jgi:serine/threonine-protein kinase HipA
MRIFGTQDPPEFPITLTETEQCGSKLVLAHATIPGVQPKLSLDLQPAANGHSRRFTIIGLDGHWGGYILKPQTKQYEELPENEGLTMHLAEIASLTTATHSLMRMVSGELAYIVKRFDRVRKKDVLQKLAQEDMCQLTERLTSDKYKGSLEQIGRAIQRYSSSPGFDLIRFFELNLFCYLVGNADMHLKNFALLTSGGQTALSPAYDLLSTAIVLEDNEETALALNGKKSNLRPKDWMQFGQTMGIPNKSAEDSLQNLLSKLPEMISFISISFLSKGRKEKLTAIVKSRSAVLNS